MRVTLTTDYALRVLMFVATKGEQLSTIPEIAERFQISRAHLMKVVHHLGMSGYLVTLRGKNGGIRLLRPAAEINIGEVVRETEEDLSVIGCLETRDYCAIEKACILRRAFREATEAFLGVLDGYTLADLMKPRATLARLLQLEAVA